MQIFDDTQLDRTEGRIIAFEETPQWCQVLLTNGHEVTAIDPNVASDPNHPLVLAYEPDRYCLISQNKDRLARKAANSP